MILEALEVLLALRHRQRDEAALAATSLAFDSYARPEALAVSGLRAVENEAL